jgi:hypothetical protein
LRQYERDLLSARRADAGDSERRSFVSDPTPLPDRPSLEQLRKQARERQRATPNATLAEAQFALAREYGFESWAKLKHHVESLPSAALEQHERIAADMVLVYRERDEAAARRLNDLFHSELDIDQIRRFIEDRLFWLPESGRRLDDLQLRDTQLLVARLYGFESWQALVETATRRASTDEPSARLGISARPPFYRIDAARNTIEPRQPMSDRDWDVLIAVAKERQLTGIRANQQMSDAVLAKIASLEHVTRLNLDGCDRLSDDGLAHLERMPQIEELDLSGWRSRITDRGLLVLRHLKKLRRFQMAWPQRVTDTGVANLRECPDLEDVGLMGTHTGDGAVQALAGKPRLRKLFAGTGVTDEGLAWLAGYPGFAIWPDVKPQYSLMEFQAGPTWLAIEGPFSAAGLRALCKLDGLFALNLNWHGSAMNSAALSTLTGLSRLGRLAIDGDRCDDEAMRQIGRLPHLKMLVAQEPVGGDDGFAALSASRTIEYIWGRECPKLTGRGFRALASMPSLRGIGVSLKFVDDAALASLPSFPSLRELMPMDVTDDGFRHVGRCARLQALWCMYCQDTGDAATDHIHELPLTTYYAGNTKITDYSLDVLGRIATLERLEFQYCQRITDAGMHSLTALPALREVKIEGSRNVTRAGAALFPPRVQVAYNAI